MTEDENPRVAREALCERYARYVVSPSLVIAMESGEGVQVIIDPNLDYPGGRDAALKEIVALLKRVGARPLPYSTRHHVFAKLNAAQLSELVKIDGDEEAAPRTLAEASEALRKARAIYKVWRDTPLLAHLDRSVRLVKADACARTFGSEGRGVTWAVIDSGIDKDHPHFITYDSLGQNVAQGANVGAPPAPAEHRDFTGEGDPLRDDFGHGTHVAGIIAGATPCDPPVLGDPAPRPSAPGAVRLSRRRDETKSVRLHAEVIGHGLSGVAPRCRLVSLKVLNAEGKGHESALLAALDHVDELNADGQRIRIHGVNISIGYPFEAEWYAAGQSPVCVAVDRLVAHGVIVVVSAGNEGSVMIRPEGSDGNKRIGLDQSISDPGNAARAITVGSTHPEAPHTFGVSYFSSRGPTADGRAKPDLVAPGERILSCASSATVREACEDIRLVEKFTPEAGVAYYREESGTSMAAPHVSGACAAFLSVHKEFVGQPEAVKAALLESATDLDRKRDFQGAGLLDLLRAIQSR
ncbi:peptidase S8/S53 subtilisin kexin sedolisin [Caulobacter flavus]|uniref:Peptidase S8/S53 subtilisin kexin sedolisin n=1 Tax=Caulobacter flavus TaxID=1679497 RepID=A0A2N5D5T5_9CAUL|nr:S8 family peptidase [Caulobacter flavus]AYV46028.1 peptidase S8/S53 subtilisin kexin sedolisin [Caulobacter flavus]PLR21429.1 peptidase S8/S53 subtilisin kexin sedolisin [Caulobacter flavus]